MNKFFQTLLVSALVFGAAAAEMPRIFMAGDSTMCDRKTTVKMAGWGQLLRKYVKDGVVITNMAVSGYSSKSFISSGRWDKLVSQVKKGDYVIVQFGHNDQKKKDSKRYAEVNSEYKDNLRKFISETRAKGGSAVIATSISRRFFNKKGEFADPAKLREYAEAAIEVGKECGVPVVDLNTLTKKLIISEGKEKSGELFFFHYNKKDNTHTTGKGANLIAGLFVQDAKAQGLEIAKLFK